MRKFVPTWDGAYVRRRGQRGWVREVTRGMEREVTRGSNVRERARAHATHDAKKAQEGLSEKTRGHKRGATKIVYSSVLTCLDLCVENGRLETVPVENDEGDVIAFTTYYARPLVHYGSYVQKQKHQKRGSLDVLYILHAFKCIYL